MRNLEHQKFSIKTEFWIPLSSYEAEVIKANLHLMLSLTSHISIHPGLRLSTDFQILWREQPYPFYTEQKVNQPVQEKWVIHFLSFTRYTDTNGRLLYVHFSFSNVSCLVWQKEGQQKAKFPLSYALNRLEHTVKNYSGHRYGNYT